MAERRSTDKAHLDKTIPIYQIVMMLLALVSSVITIVVYQSGIDSTQNIEISKNTSDIAANKEASRKFESHVIRSLDQINARGQRQEDKTEQFYKLFVDYFRSQEK